MVKKVSLLSLFHLHTRRVEMIYLKVLNGPCGVMNLGGRVSFRGTTVKIKTERQAWFLFLESQLLGFRTVVPATVMFQKVFFLTF